MFGPTTVEINGVDLVYEVEGEGPPLVLIHGWAVHRRYWDGAAELLARDFRVIRYDRRGFGQSAGKPDPTADANDLKALLETLSIPRAHIMGHSQGTDAALTFAARYPGMVDRLVLFGPGPLPGLNLPPTDSDPPFAEWIAIGQSRGVEAMKGAISSWSEEAFGDPEMVERARALLDLYSGADLLDPAPPSNLVTPAGIEDLLSVRAPTLVIHGETEMAGIQIVADVLMYGIPGARKRVVPGGGHVVNWSEPERFVAEVARFLRGP
jgi:pimeloyl-ACP methyl ester carboxylesterase